MAADNFVCCAGVQLQDGEERGLLCDFDGRVVQAEFKEGAVACVPPAVQVGTLEDCSMDWPGNRAFHEATLCALARPIDARPISHALQAGDVEQAGLRLRVTTRAGRTLRDSVLPPNELLPAAPDGTEATSKAGEGLQAGGSSLQVDQATGGAAPAEPSGRGRSLRQRYSALRPFVIIRWVCGLWILFSPLPTDTACCEEASAHTLQPRSK